MGVTQFAMMSGQFRRKGVKKLINRSGSDGEGSTYELLVRASSRIAVCGVVAQYRVADAGEFSPPKSSTQLAIPDTELRSYGNVFFKLIGLHKQFFCSVDRYHLLSLNATWVIHPEMLSELQKPIAEYRPALYGAKNAEDIAGLEIFLEYP